MGGLFSELKRRKVFRVATAYLVVAWAMLEFVSVVTPMLRLPEWIGPFVLMLLTIALGAAVAFAWTFEITPEGLKRAMPSTGGADTAAGSRLDWALIAASVAIIALVAYQQISPRSDRNAAPRASSPATAPVEGVSIAVLPFVNLSGDPSQEFFSDGTTEEITSALAKVKGLRVVGRTSAFEFKGQNKDLRAIGLALGASHLLEGSVRKAGNRVRITGQLIRADDGTHIWTENYDRELTDIFATQDDIARAIAGALRAPLGLKSGESLVSRHTGEPGLHEEFLRAKAMFRARIDLPRAVQEVVVALEALVARDPNYAPAWALLATVYAGAPSPVAARDLEQRRRAVETYLPKAEAAGRRAIELDPASADSYVGLALTLQSRGKYEEAEDLYQKGLALDPVNPDLLHFYAQALQFSGRVKEAAEIRRQLLLLEPLVPILIQWAGNTHLEAGQYETALTYFKRTPSASGGSLVADFVLTYVLLGRGGEAADLLLEGRPGIPPEEAAAAAKLLRAPSPATVPRHLPDFQALYPVYLHVGAQQRFFDSRLVLWENTIAAGYNYPRFSMWGPEYAPARKTERFKALMRKAGLVDYWRARGWPDTCRPVGANDFECD